MENGPFDDQIFQDFGDRNKNVHSIQVMLGLNHSDMVFSSGQSPNKIHDSGNLVHHDLGPLFQNGMDNGLRGNSGNGKLMDDGLSSQSISAVSEPTSCGTPPLNSNVKKNESKNKKQDNNNGIKKKKTR